MLQIVVPHDSLFWIFHNVLSILILMDCKIAVVLFYCFYEHHYICWPLHVHELLKDLLTQCMSTVKQHQRHLEACQKFRLSSFIQDWLNQNVHLTKLSVTFVQIKIWKALPKKEVLESEITKSLELNAQTFFVNGYYRI